MSDLSAFIHDEFDAAWNAHDLDRVLRLFADDAVVEMPTPPPGAPPLFRGPQQIRQFVEMLIDGFHVESTNIHEEGDHVSWFSTVENDDFRQMGLGSADAVCEAVVSGGKVRAFTPRFTPSTLARMQAAQNKALMQQIYDAFNSGDYSALYDVIAPDAIEHEPMPGVEAETAPARVEQWVNGFRAAFPDIRFDVLDMRAEGDRVYTHFAMRGTHRGDFMGIPATGNRIDVPAVDIVRFEDDRAVEHWGMAHETAMMQQLGLAPEDAGLQGDGALAAAAPDTEALIRSIYDAFNRRDYDHARRVMHPDAELVNVATGETHRGPDGMRAFMEGWTRAFPNGQTEVTRLAVAGETVVAEFVGRGTHDGPLATPAGDVPPTGRAVEVPFCDVWTVRGGQIVGNRTYFDLATMMRQLGLAPANA